jgi:hypothetical protein
MGHAGGSRDVAAASAGRGPGDQIAAAAVVSVGCFGAILWEQRAAFVRRARRPRLVPRGKRRLVLAGLVVVTVAGFALALGAGPGSPWRSDGRYYLTKDGRRVETGRRSYLRAEAVQGRGLASGVLLLSGVCGLVLSAPAIDNERPDTDGLSNVDHRAIGPLSWWQRVCGYRRVEGETSEPVPAVLDQLRPVVPIRAELGLNATVADVRAAWFDGQRWPSRVAPAMWLTGTITQRLTTTSRVELLVLPGDAAARRRPPGLAVSVVIVLMGLAFGMAGLVTQAFLLFVPLILFVGVGLLDVVITGSQPSRTAKRVVTRLAIALQLEPDAATR